ncbi:hypothetical protein J1614_000024, partial [Plenodomus biglobosus]
MASSSTSSTSMMIEQVLNVYLGCFNAAADAAPPLLFSYTQQLQYPEVELPAWRIWTVDDLNNPPEDLHNISFAPEWMPEALKKKDLCDHFALLFEAEVDRKLQDFGASAQCIQYFPAVEFILATFGPHQLSMPLHSTLLINKQDGNAIVFDGSLEQFGWHKETLLQPEQDFLATREPACGFATQKSRTKTRVAIQNGDKGIWEHLRIRMDELFRELDWDELDKMDDEKRNEAVKRQAEDKFANVKMIFNDCSFREDLNQQILGNCCQETK